MKRKVAERVKQRKASVQDALSFFKCCVENLNVSVKFFFVSCSEIEKFSSHELSSIFQDAPELKGVKSSHHFYVHNGKIVMKPYSTFPSTPNQNISISCGSISGVERQIKINDCVKVLCEPYKGYYAIVTSESYGDEWEIQYFKKSFDKFVLKEGDFDSRELKELRPVDPTVDQRGRYTFSE